MAGMILAFCFSHFGSPSLGGVCAVREGLSCSRGTREKELLSTHNTAEKEKEVIHLPGRISGAMSAVGELNRGGGNPGLMSLMDLGKLVSTSAIAEIAGAKTGVRRQRGSPPPGRRAVTLLPLTCSGLVAGYACGKESHKSSMAMHMLSAATTGVDAKATILSTKHDLQDKRGTSSGISE
jgi:hypothetical protein